MQGGQVTPMHPAALPPPGARADFLPAHESLVSRTMIMEVPLIWLSVGDEVQFFSCENRSSLRTDRPRPALRRPRASHPRHRSLVSPHGGECPPNLAGIGALSCSVGKDEDRRFCRTSSRLFDRSAAESHRYHDERHGARVRCGVAESDHGALRRSARPSARS